MRPRTTRLKALSVVIGQSSVTAVDARAHTATSSAGRMVDRFVPRIRIPFTAASPRRVGARSGSRARERAVASVRRQGTPGRACSGLHGCDPTAGPGSRGASRLLGSRETPYRFSEDTHVWSQARHEPGSPGRRPRVTGRPRGPGPGGGRQVDGHGLHVRRQQPRGLYRQGPGAGAGGPRLQHLGADHRPRRPRTGLRQEPRRLADHQALSPDPGHARRCRQRGGRLGRAQPGRPRYPGRLRRVVQGDLPGRPLRPLLLGPRLGLASRLDDGGRHPGQRWPRSRRGQVGHGPAGLHRRRRL